MSNKRPDRLAELGSLLENDLDLPRRVAEGTATPDQARRLLAEFVEWHEHRATPPDNLIAHAAHCFAAYLSSERRLCPAHDDGKCVKKVGVRTLDQAFGVVRLTSGRPATEPAVRRGVATAVLQRLIKGDSLDAAAFDIEVERKQKQQPLASETEIREAWADYKREALDTLESLCAIIGEPIARTDSEMRTQFRTAAKRW